MAPPRNVDLPINLGFVVPRLSAGIVVGERCWEWTGRKSRDGYGVMLVPDGEGGQRAERIHRLVWRILVGPIGPFPLHHKCENRPCCNPADLERVTDEDHGLVHRRAECPKRHPLVGDNLMVKPDGHPRCRICANERDKKSRRAKSTFARGDHKTECKHGHPWVPENIYTKPKTGHRECRMCMAERATRRKVAST